MQENFSCTGTHIASSALGVQGTNTGTDETYCLNWVEDKCLSVKTSP